MAQESTKTHAAASVRHVRDGVRGALSCFVDVACCFILLLRLDPFTGVPAPVAPAHLASLPCALPAAATAPLPAPARNQYGRSRWSAARSHAVGHRRSSATR